MDPTAPLSTQGLEIRTGSGALRAAVELLSSMRFAISLLSVICVASIIGTVLRQQEPLTNYVNQFGPFWADVFAALGLYSVYSAWWFLLILAFLVTSTSLCIARNTPKILAGLNDLKLDMREQSLRAFGHRAEAALAEPPAAAARRIAQALTRRGWKTRAQQRGDAIMLAAKAGSANKLGYIAAHSSIVLICLGGLADGDLVVRAQMWLGDKSLYTGGGLIADVPERHRLPASNPTYRANLLVSEGATAQTALINQPGGVLLQELPFSVELKKFVVEHYSTGMPKLFASEIVIHDKQDGTRLERRVEVNHPVSYKGIDIFQSSFDDGGSKVSLRALPLGAGAGAAFDVDGQIGASTELSNGATKLQLEFSALRVINVENFGASATTSGADVRKVDLRQAIDARLGAGNKTATKKELRNVGPSITYKLRDAAGQANEFQNYMLPIDLDEGVPLYLMGFRQNATDSMRYLRIPADDQGGVDGFMRMRTALQQPAAREKAVRRYVVKAVDPKKPELAEQLGASALRALALFAGADAGSAAPAGPSAGPAAAGLQAVSDFIEANVPPDEREKAGEVLVRILNGVLFELLQLTREQAGLPALTPGESTQAFMTAAVLALSDAGSYPAPMAFQLKNFEQRQASVFQVARAPGRTVVYLGCALLILGVFAMLYVRERRLWVWLAPRADGAEGTQARMALSSNRQTLDTDQEFARLRQTLMESST